MEVSHVQDRVQKIAKAQEDPEEAHFLEDDLWRAVLKAIAAESSDPHARSLASEALKTMKVEFERWYA